MIDEDACLGSTLIKYQINSLMKGEDWLCSVKTKTLFKA